MSVYLDMAFLINFLFDAEILFLTLSVLSKKIVYHRIIFAALVGGLEGVFVFFPYFRILSIPPISFLIPLLMIRIAFKTYTIRELAESYILFLIISFLLGGAATFLKAGTIFALSLILPLYFILLNIRKRIFKKSYRITLYYKGKKIEKNAIYDSGNTVFYLGKPVIFGDRRLFCEILDREFSKKDVFKGEIKDDICIVPYKSMGKDGLAAGIRLENAIVSEKRYENTVICLFEGNLEDSVILNGIMV